MTRINLNLYTFDSKYILIIRSEVSILALVKKTKFMKNVVLILSTIAFVACGGGDEKNKVSADATYEERVKDVCDCFSKDAESNDCYMLQANHIKHLGADKVLEFSKDIGECKTK